MWCVFRPSKQTRNLSPIYRIFFWLTLHFWWENIYFCEQFIIYSYLFSIKSAQWWQWHSVSVEQFKHFSVTQTKKKCEKIAFANHRHQIAMKTERQMKKMICVQILMEFVWNQAKKEKHRNDVHVIFQFAEMPHPHIHTTSLIRSAVPQHLKWFSHWGWQFFLEMDFPLWTMRCVAIWIARLSFYIFNFGFYLLIYLFVYLQMT